MKVNRGTIYTADLNPRYGTEPGKMRPVLVLQTNPLNKHHASTIICPLTSKIRKDSVLLRVHLKRGTSGLKQDCDVMIDQIRAIDNRRLKKKVGQLSDLNMKQIEERIKIVLDL